MVMLLTEKQKIKHVTWITAIGFLGSAFTFVLTIFIAPLPDFSSEVPKISQLMLTMGQIGTALLIIGCVAYGIKMAEEKKTIHAIGFTSMSVAQGILFVLYLISYNGHEKFEEAYRMFSASLYLLIPSMLLIAIYSEFPKWLRILGAVACIPYAVENILFSFTGKFDETIMMIDGIGNILFNFVYICWGIYVLRNLKQELKEINSM